MSFIKRLFGICATPQPADAGCCQREDRALTIDLTRAPELAQPGGALRFEGETPEQRVLVVHGLDGGYHAYPNRCTHGGRRLDAVPGEPLVRCCSVGQSTFSYDGLRRSGSAQLDIEPLVVEESDARLVVRLPEPAVAQP